MGLTPLGGTAAAQGVAPAPVEQPALDRPSSLQSDRARLRQLRGDTTGLDTYFLRSPSLLLPRTPGVTWLPPDALVTINPSFPYSANDGMLWAGKGLGVRFGGGAAYASGRWRVVVAPELAYTTNAPFETNENGKFVSPPVPSARAADAPYLDPWYVRPYSADVPRRFGPKAFVALAPGQSGVWFDAGVVEVGATSENTWWGPGIRNGILMSDNAAGVPRLELRLPRPWRTTYGAVDARWFVGALQESKYFDNDPSNDVRSLAAAAVTWRPWFQPLLTLGVERSVFAAVSGYGKVPLRLFDVFAGTGHPADHPIIDSTLTPGGRDQLFGVFGRWLLAADGVEVYAEWVRQELPRTLREAAAAPTHSHGYTIGLQWQQRVPSSAPALRIQGEITMLEQSASFRDRNVGVFYTSRRVLQGYTENGQPVGAAIGPGSSSQWLAFDRVAPTWSWGITFNRVRWNEDVHSTYAWPGFAAYCNHDVSNIPGARGSRILPLGTIGAEVMFNVRHNMFFQNVGGCMAGIGDVVDASNPSLRLTFTRALHW